MADAQPDTDRCTPHLCAVWGHHVSLRWIELHDSDGYDLGPLAGVPRCEVPQIRPGLLILEWGYREPYLPPSYGLLDLRGGEGGIGPSDLTPH